MEYYLQLQNIGTPSNKDESEKYSEPKKPNTKLYTLYYFI